MDRKMVNFIKEAVSARHHASASTQWRIPLPLATEGVVDFVDDIDTIHMKWR